MFNYLVIKDDKVSNYKFIQVIKICHITEQCNIIMSNWF